MTEEPRWPDKWPVNTDYDIGDSRARVRNAAIDECRAAWLASVDDPSVDPVGTRRRSPNGVEVIRFDISHNSSTTPAWFVYTESEPFGRRAVDDATVKGWAVIGTPAAEAKP